MDPSPEVAASRRRRRGLRAATGPFVVVAPYLAAMQRMPPTLGTVAGLELVTGVELRPTRSRSGSAWGYARVDVVEHRGEFAVRGGVVDVFSGDRPTPRAPGVLGR